MRAELKDADQINLTSVGPRKSKEDEEESLSSKGTPTATPLNTCGARACVTSVSQSVGECVIESVTLKRHETGVKSQQKACKNIGNLLSSIYKERKTDIFGHLLLPCLWG